jgi:hypothetical protein
MLRTKKGESYDGLVLRVGTEFRDARTATGTFDFSGFDGMRSGRELSEDDAESEPELDEELLEVSSESESESLDDEESEEEDGSSSRLRFKDLVFEDTCGRGAIDDCLNFLCVSFVSLDVYNSTWKIH